MMLPFWLKAILWLIAFGITLKMWANAYGALIAFFDNKGES